MLTQDQVNIICNFIDEQINLLKSEYGKFSDSSERILGIMDLMNSLTAFKNIQVSSIPKYIHDKEALNIASKIEKLCYLEDLDELDDQLSISLHQVSIEEIRQCAYLYFQLKRRYIGLGSTESTLEQIKKQEDKFRDNYLSNPISRAIEKQKKEIDAAYKTKLIQDTFHAWIMRGQIDDFQFQDEIKAIQAIATNLDNDGIAGGKEKAQKIRTALNNAIEDAITAKVKEDKILFKSFQELKDYYRKNNTDVESQSLSLTNALDSRRHSFWDKMVGKKTSQSTEKMLEAEREKWILAQGPELQQEIHRIQYHIGRLNSRLIPRGKDKAKQIQDALNRAIDAAREGKGKLRKNLLEGAENDPKKFVAKFKEFKLDEEKSLDAVLAIKRYSLFSKNKEAKSVRGEKSEIKSENKNNQ